MYARKKQESERDSKVSVDGRVEVRYLPCECEIKAGVIRRLLGQLEIERTPVVNLSIWPSPTITKENLVPALELTFFAPFLNVCTMKVMKSGEFYDRHLRTSATSPLAPLSFPIRL